MGACQGEINQVKLFREKTGFYFLHPIKKAQVSIKIGIPGAKPLKQSQLGLYAHLKQVLTGRMPELFTLPSGLNKNTVC